MKYVITRCENHRIISFISFRLQTYQNNNYPDVFVSIVVQILSLLNDKQLSIKGLMNATSLS